MRFIACQNDECDNKGAPYHDHEPDEVIVLCPLCEKAMTVIPDPTVERPDEGGE
jgi:hypothetical protein